jgi:imidazolonepropionase-like amidohydrolase
MFASMQPSTGATLSTLRELLDDTRTFVTARVAWEKGESRDYRWNRTDLEAMRPVAEGKLPLVIGADRASDIEALLAFAAEQRIRVIIRGAAEGHLVASRLAQANVPVILDPFVYGPGGYDQIHASPANAARLHAAGVRVALSSYSAHNLRKLRQAAGNAVREGLRWEAAFDAITAVPARLFEMTGYGVLSAGAWANVVVWSGDPLEIDTQVTQLFIRGREMALTSRQTELMERYRHLPGTPQPALPLPSR